MPNTERSINLPPLERRAALSTVNEAARTAELIFSTGADVERRDFDTGRKYVERLSLDPRHVRLDRLDSGAAPLLNSHGADGLIDQIGVVEPDSVRLAPGEARATVRFSKRLDVEKIFVDVCDRIIRNVSVGYKVFRFEELAGARNEIPVRVAVDWMPFELSLVCMGADPGAHVRQVSTGVVTNPCVLVASGASTAERTDADRLRLLRLAQARW